MAAKQPRAIPNLQPAIDRLKAIAAHSGDCLLLADGPPNPDAALLDLCADIAQQRKATDAVWERWRATQSHDARHPLYEEARRRTDALGLAEARRQAAGHDGV